MTRRERRARDFSTGKPTVAHPRVEPLMPGPPVLYPGETILEDDYPVFGDYLYVGDGLVIRSDVFGTVRDFKRVHGVAEVRRCEIGARRRAMGLGG